jgi:Spondin_N/PEP-CTERM motif
VLRAPLICASVACLAVLSVSPALAVNVRVTIRNLSASDSVALSPFTLAAHDGTFDAFDAGSAASIGIENVAELGDGTDLLAAINSAQPSAVTATAIATSGGFGPGIFPPGASGSIILTLDPVMNRYLSYGSMVVPSNDSFLGNDSPTAVELFDAGGNFVAADFTLNGSAIWDAGTEVNQLTGAAYVVGEDATLGTDENGVIQLANLATQFSPYVGSSTPVGATFLTAPGAATPVASFSFELVPEPSALVLATMALCGLVVARRRRQA